MKTLLLALALTLPAQDGVEELIQKLRSEKIEERDAAAKKLADLGEAAKTALRALRKDRDPEVAARAGTILGQIDGMERARKFLVPSRKATATVRSLSLEDAASKVFAPFGLAARVRAPLGGDLGIMVVSLEIQDASFWEAVDRFCEAGRVCHVTTGFAGAQTPELAFGNDPFPASWDTLGDVRVYGFLLGVVAPDELTPRFWIECPPWAVPKSARIVRLKLSGWPGDPVDRASAVEAAALPRAAGRMTTAPLPVDVPHAPREALKGAGSVDAEGILGITTGDEKGGDETLVPFTLRGIPVPRR